jgi:hypothetical protein
MRHRPLDVSKWTCAHVAQWLGEQQWEWKELPAYQARLCSVGVDGAVLYQLDDHDLRHDIKVRGALVCLLSGSARSLAHVSAKPVLAVHACHSACQPCMQYRRARATS